MLGVYGGNQDTLVLVWFYHGSSQSSISAKFSVSSCLHPSQKEYNNILFLESFLVLKGVCLVVGLFAFQYCLLMEAGSME